MFIDSVIKYTNKEIYDLSCSETMIVAANDYFNLDLSSDAIHMMAPFSSGMMVEETCGALSGAIAVLGILFTRECSHNSPFMKEMVQEFIERFNKKTSSINCIELKSLYRSETKGCYDIIVYAGEILQDMIMREYDQITRKGMD